MKNKININDLYKVSPGEQDRLIKINNELLFMIDKSSEKYKELLKEEFNIQKKVIFRSFKRHPIFSHIFNKDSLYNIDLKKLAIVLYDHPYLMNDPEYREFFSKLIDEKRNEFDNAYEQLFYEKE